jgi:hypothetical protein
VHVLLATERGRIALGHVLLHDLDGARAHDEERAEVANRGRQDIAGAIGAAPEGKRAAHGGRFLPERAVQAADDFVLAVEVYEDLLDFAGELQVVVDLVELRPIQPSAECRWRLLNVHVHEGSNPSPRQS